MGLDEDRAIELMQRKCRAVFYHYIKQDDADEQHQYCLEGASRYIS
jgi:hypothetical protein